MKQMKFFGPSLVLFLVLALMLSVAPYMVRQIAIADEAARLTQDKKLLDETTPRLSDLRMAFRQVSKVVEPSVVHISVLRQGRPGSGSGWVYDKSGHIITNNHVVENTSAIKVRFNDKSEYSATIVGTDVDTDIAVIKVNRQGLFPAARADFDEEMPQRGDIVFAFGSPFQYEFSMTQGIISGLGRQTYALGEYGYENFLQTDAAINPGNSGGPLTDIKGQVIGMNTMIPTRDGVFSGIGLAIPVDMINPVVDQLIKYGKVTRGYLGISMSSDPRELKRLNLEHGIRVNAIAPGQPAEKAGLRAGDVILEMDGRKLEDQAAFRRAIASKNPGREIGLKVWRSGKEIDLTATLTKLPSKQDLEAMRRSMSLNTPAVDPAQELGLSDIFPFSPEMAQRLNMNYRAGVIVGKVQRGSLADRAGIEQGMVITEVKGFPVSDLRSLQQLLYRFRNDADLRMTVWDGLASKYVDLNKP